MTERFELDPSEDLHGEADGPLPEAWIRSMKDAMSQEAAPPTPAPKDAMWREIEARIGAPPAHVVGRRQRSGAGSPWVWGLAASAVLLAGIAIGRGNVTPAVPPAASPSSPAGVDGRIVRDVAARHLASSETLLSFVGVDLARGDVDADLAARGRRLLADTRMLLSVTPDQEVELRSLLVDLELVLTQLALLEGAEFDDTRRAEEVGLLAAGLRGSDLVPRIQGALPRLDSRRRPMSSTD